MSGKRQHDVRPIAFVAGDSVKELQDLPPVMFKRSQHPLRFIVIDRREQREMTQSTGAASAQLVDIAHRMEQRIEALEQILDAEAPGWRKRHHE